MQLVRRVGANKAIYAGAILCGVAGCLSYFSRLLQDRVINPEPVAATLAYLIFVFSVVSAIVLFRAHFAFRTLKKTAKRQVLLMFCLAAPTSIALYSIALIPAPDGLRLFGTRETELEIVATGRNSSLSQGGEVWLQSITTGDGHQILLENIRTTEGWEWVDSSLMTVGSHAVALRVDHPGFLNGGEVTLIAHPWSGIAQITLGDQSQTIDLYSHLSEARTVFLSGNASTSVLYQATRWLTIAGEILLISMTVTVASAIALKRLGKS